MALTLVIGNKNYSSWSLRPWIAMRVAAIAFDKIVIPLYEAGSRERVLAFSPTGKVPALADGEIRVWESLAILDYLAEKFPQAGLWPSDVKARAQARAVAAEMHAGFAPLRRHCPMNISRPAKTRELTTEAAADVRRIEALWTDCRTRFGKDGAFLFGAFGAADAMYAPVVTRFHTYGIAVDPAARAYMEAILALPAFAEWRAGALAERWVLPQSEVDWPAVPRV
jgi:glutathione S-transferase